MFGFELVYDGNPGTTFLFGLMAGFVLAWVCDYLALRWAWRRKDR